MATSLAAVTVLVATSNSTAAWLAHRARLVDSVLGYGSGELPTRSKPDWIVNGVAPNGVTELIWNLSNGRFDINATVFYAPRSGDPKKPAAQAFLFHHGHTNCICGAHVPALHPPLPAVGLGLAARSARPSG